MLSTRGRGNKDGRAVIGNIINTLVIWIYLDNYNIGYSGVMSVLVYSLILTIITNRTWDYLVKKYGNEEDDTVEDELVLVEEVEENKKVSRRDRRRNKKK